MKLAHAMVGELLHNMPKDRASTDLHHWLRLDFGFFESRVPYRPQVSLLSSFLFRMLRLLEWRYSFVQFSIGLMIPGYGPAYHDARSPPPSDRQSERQPRRARRNGRLLDQVCLRLLRR